MAVLLAGVKKLVQAPGVQRASLLFIVARIFLSLWAILSLAINPLPAVADEIVRPYLGEPPIEKGIAGLLLGPWQRFDTQRYMHLASHGYVNEENSVFPPLYPLMINLLAIALGGSSPAYLLSGILLANLACLSLLILFHRVMTAELDSAAANRGLLYLVFFPTGFFLFAPYSESLYMLAALASLWAARRGRFGWAGILGFLAAGTRISGWILVVPLAYEYWQQNMSVGLELSSRSRLQGMKNMIRQPALYALALPGVAVAGFLAWRSWYGLPSLGQVYAQYWYQTVSLPGVDLYSAVRSLFLGGSARNNELIALALDFAAAWLLLVTTYFAFRRLPTTYALYSAMLLLFILLPSSEVKPLYSFSRYALAFSPTFMLLGAAGWRPMINRLILYPFLLLYLYFSGQFFVWGWVA
jgi:hypothetical protein